uniref:ABC transporter G family member 20-like n=1 Tax=Diabrotica virgifera virgifera TaxID=50390 RepID=A0A6P7FGR9_DIAVI
MDTAATESSKKEPQKPKMFSWQSVTFSEGTTMGDRVEPQVPGPDLVGVNVERPPLVHQQSTVWNRRQNAVSVRHAYKHYGSKKKPNHVLSDLNMTVGKGTIYGLLGASGCGKTTLLSCIVGRRRLNTGEIWVLGGKPGTKGSGVPGKRVGYMPQEIALYGEFTIKETMMYFGWIFGMESKEIYERLQFLLNFLDLPSQNRMVKNLSGGQQRRVSFAVALMHDPELLILDEPTVGVDPLLRQSIWNHLVQITKDGNKTVIITTHYIEEARQAHTVTLQREFGHPTEVRVSLSTIRRRILDLGLRSLRPIRMGKPPSSATHGIKEACDDCSSCSDFTTTGKLRALLQKNFLRMWRNVGVMLFIFALPVMQVILFCLAIGGDPKGLKLAIVNHEKNFTNLTYQECEYEKGCKFGNLSCRYVDTINTTTIIKQYYATPEEAKEAVRTGNAWGALYFTENFTDALVARMALGKDADEETLDQSEVRVWLDMSNQQIGIILQRDLQLAFQNFTKDIFRDCEYNEELAEIPISFKEPIYGSNQPSFTDFVAPGVILTIVFFLAVALTSSALIIERMEGLLDRSWVAGVTPSEILFSHVITQFVVMCGQTTLVLIFMIIVFQVECKGDIFLVVVITILQGLCGMCFGFVISAICELERNAIQLALGSFYPTLLLSGVIWPIEGMPTVLRYISTFLPLTLATTSLRSMMTRGWSIGEPDVYYGFIATIVWIVLFLTISLLVLRSKRG